MEDAQYPAVTLCLEEPFTEKLSAFNVTKNQYINPRLYNYQNISHLYTIPYEDISLSINDDNFKLETLISLRNKTHLFNKFKFRGKYFGLHIS